MTDNVVELRKSPVVVQRNAMDPDKVDPRQFIAACGNCDTSAFKLYADGVITCWECDEVLFLRSYDPSKPKAGEGE